MGEAVCVVSLRCVNNPPCSVACAFGDLVPPPPAVKLCLFRSCGWQSENIADAPPEVQDEIVARHLLAAHRQELRALGRFAEECELL